MNILSVSKLQKEFNGDVLFNNISFEINSKDKIAIIGKNGTGKSTLIKMIIGDLDIDKGDVYKNSKAVFGYLSQDVISSKNNTLIFEMREVFKDLINLGEKIALLTEKLALMPDDKELLKRYSTMEHNYEIQGGYEYHYKIDLILSKFGFTKDEYKREIITFSGGEKTRIAFAKLLLINPDLLILDEPTNHLDIDIIEWLEDYLNKYAGAVLIVTHDKYFISKVCRKIIEIDHGTSHVYHGSYEEYQLEKVKRYEILLKHYNRQQKEIEHLQSFVDRFRYNAKKASIAQDRVKKIDRMVKLDKPTISRSKVKMAFENKRATREIILEAKNLSIGYEKPLLSSINFTMRGYDKLAIIGPNGTGKTTLLKIIEKKLKPLAGKIDFLREYKVGYFDQNQEGLSYNKTIFEEIHDYYPRFTNKEVRSVAARFLFMNEDALKPISVLSGGEKVRLVLLLLMLSNPDLLILDEPTNHLDIETKDIIEDVFNEFSGPIIFVSHDRYFINKIGTKIIHLSDSDVTEFEGSYEEFKELKKEKIVKKSKLKKQNNIKIDYEKEIKSLEKEIHKIEKRIKELEQDTFKVEVYTNHLEIKRVNEKIDLLKGELILLEKQYYELHEL
ncbi:MAG: putative ABC transporter ATP-binding protein YheS [Candidatus Izimaplasma bacterium HR2]|nr:MAG: putative ABC transporter ATP-binding protein YheS [Candidatus Izimaplasma bacterium HR2]